MIASNEIQFYFIFLIISNFISPGQMSSFDHWFSSATVESRTIWRTVIVAMAVVAVWIAWIKSGCATSMSAAPSIQMTISSVGARWSSPMLGSPSVFSVDAGPVGGEIIHSEKENQKSRKFDHIFFWPTLTVASWEPQFYSRIFRDFELVIFDLIHFSLPKASFQ